MKKVFTLFCIALITWGLNAQNFDLRLTKLGSNSIAVQMRETSGKPPQNTDLLTDLVFGICWDKNYKVDLGSVVSNYSIRKASPETVAGGIEYQLFAKDPSPLSFPAVWGSNEWVTIMQVPNSMSSNQTYGTFSVCPTSLQELNINYNLTDYRVGAKGNATGVQIGSILPNDVKLFSARLDSTQSVDLEWLTTSSVQYKQYELEYSTDGKSFVKFANVSAKNDNNPEQRYNYVHKPQLSGMHYYRLKMFDSKGHFEYSPIRIIQTEYANDWNIMPNPGKENFTVRLESVVAQDIQVSVTDVSGKVVYQDIIGVQAGANSHNIRLLGIGAGVYQLNLRWSDGMSQTKNFVVSK
jgi:hypothetical protein